MLTVGMMSPFGLVEKDCLEAGDVGYITASIKTVSETRVGDTITLAEGGVKGTSCRDSKRRFRWSFRVYIRRTERATEI